VLFHTNPLFGISPKYDQKARTLPRQKLTPWSSSAHPTPLIGIRAKRLKFASNWRILTDPRPNVVACYPPTHELRKAIEQRRNK
jgi:hypothetical protein